MQKFIVLLSLAGFLTLQASSASAIPIQITTSQQTGGIYSILNSNNQIVDFSVSGGTAMAGAELFIQIGDGGSNNAPPGTSNNGGATVPTINTTAANPIDTTQGIFGNNPGNEGRTISGDKLLGFDATNTSSGTVAATGLLGTLNLNATGISSGTMFTVQLFNVGANDATFGGGTSDWTTSGSVSSNFTGDGMSAPFTLEVVPEPAVGILMAGGIAFLLASRLGRKRAAV